MRNNRFNRLILISTALVFLLGAGAVAAKEDGKIVHDAEYYILEAQRRTLEFIERNAKAGKPFYVANWPNLTSFIPNPKKCSTSRSILQDGLQCNIDPFVGQVMDKLKELGIAENTLVIAMADNGPMTHNPPPGLGMAETIYRGGKGDFLEGGVRVPAFAWWLGVIQPGQVVGDIIHETDLFATFARLAGATRHIPTDRVIDGIDHTAPNGSSPSSAGGCCADNCCISGNDAARFSAGLAP